MTRRAWTPTLIIASLLVLLTYLLYASKPPDLALRSRIHDALQTFALHDAELARDVLLARAGLLPHYDSLAQVRRALIEDARLLLDASSAAADPDARSVLRGHALALTVITRTKLDMVDYFKSDNAILRNSLTYVSQAQPMLRRIASANQAIAAEMSRLSHALLRFVQTPEATTSGEIRDTLDRLASAAPDNEGLQTLIRHGHFVVNTLPNVDARLRDILSTATASETRLLQGAVWQYADRVESRAQNYRILLYLAAVTLLAYLTGIFLKLRRTAVQLRTSNTKLSQEMNVRRGAELALRASEERLRAITESAREAIVSSDRIGKLVSWNAGATAIFGFGANEVLGTPIERLFSPDASRSSVHVWSEGNAAATAQHTLEIVGRRKDGSEVPLEISLSCWSSQGDTYISGIMRDVSERKRLEGIARQQQLQLIQANKMTALGTLVSGVAHEINNPNQLVLLNSRILAETWEDALDILDDYNREHSPLTLGGLPYGEMRESVPRLARDIHEGALRIERIVADLKDFARPQAAQGGTHFALNEIVNRALRLLANQIGKRCACPQVHLAEGLPHLYGNAQQVEQILVNLLVNAIEALPTRDRVITVSTRLDRATCHVVLQVQDEGAGIPAEHLQHLCEPFFTTKQASGGTGLGLAITASLVRAHKATLEFTSTPGVGTCATVRFPIAKPDTSSEDSC